MSVVIAAYLAYLSTFVEIQIGDPDRRPMGTAEDIEALSGRDDVNVLFILIDTLRADHLGTYGYDRDTSPTLDRLAERGVRFDRHLSQSSWTKSSMASMWTGLYPTRVGVTRFEHTLSAEARLPAEIMSDAGFQTVGLFRNGWVEGYFGFDQGFDVYMRPAARPPSPSVRRENPTLKSAATDASLIPAAVEFARINGDRRWLLYLHLMDLHEYLYDEDSAKFGTEFSDIYDNSILRENLILQELLRQLNLGGHLDNTLIAIASDHGEAFSERGLEGHARTVYRETTEVPFILSFPFRLEPGLAVSRRSRNIDIWPTILDLLGLPEMTGIDGRSRVPEILAAARGEQLEDDGEIGIAHLDQNWGKRDVPEAPVVAVVEDNYRYVVQWDGARKQAYEQLFDALEDPGELVNISAAQPEVADRLRKEASQYLYRKPPWDETAPDLEMDEMQLNQLRALGYKLP
ncbi:MAG: sulfatase [Deltaproteobacteria bacterium]|nr:sulfatase [Deltaproteobacteria bacterium]